MSEVKWLIITAVCLMIAASVSSFVYALASMWMLRTETEVIDRLEALEKRYQKLRDGMKRTGHWKSEYEIESPPLRVNA